MRPRLTLLALALLTVSATAALARETLAAPAVSVELTFGGQGKVTVDGKVTPLTGEQVAKLRADLAPLHPETLSRDVTRLEDLDNAASKAARETPLRARAVDREQDHVADQERQIATLEKSRKQAQDDLDEATSRNYNTNLDNLRAKLNTVNSRLASEKKELERARERLAVAKKRQAENAEEAKTSAEAAAALRKDVTARIAQVRAALKAVGV